MAWHGMAWRDCGKTNGLASLQEGRLRYVKTVRMEFTPGLQKGHVAFFNGAIRCNTTLTGPEPSFSWRL